MKSRIAGFDLARAYAIFGMFIVNFNFAFGSLMVPEGFWGRFLNLFTGNSTAIFIMCAGMGVSLMAGNGDPSPEEKARIKSVILKRSWFLFATGLLLFNWWSGDILHFYGGYLHFAAFLLFVPKRYYLVGALLAILFFHVLIFIVPLNTGWDFSMFRYVDFWTPTGFIRNTFYNGWNAMFPWLAYFFTGMWMGKLDWKLKATRQRFFASGLCIFMIIQLVRLLAKTNIFPPSATNYIMAEYFPPYLPFVLLTMSFAAMVIPVCMLIGDRFGHTAVVRALQKTGQLTLSHYVIHATLGMIILALLTGKQYTGFIEDEKPTESLIILLYSSVFYIGSVAFSVLWTRKFKTGPLELLMRKFSG
ncbi:MAG: DUF418 domain-containing protein [Bacteroidota bacterium]